MARKILITGGSGFLGVALAARLRREDPAATLLLTDVPAHPRLKRLGDEIVFVAADLTQESDRQRLLEYKPEVIYHLASLVSGGAEADFSANLNVNVMASIHLLEAARKAGNCPRFIFPSSIAAFGGRSLPDTVDDWTHLHPQNSYGVAKVVIEQLLNDYSRKGYVDGRGIRLPAIVVRDEPNTAASGYASAMIREPLSGRDYVCPVMPETRIPIASVHTAVSDFVQLAQLPAEALEDYRTMNGPGISPSAAEIAEAVRASASPGAGEITFIPDSKVVSVLASWPKIMSYPRAARLGLEADAGIEAIVKAYIEKKGQVD